jgi:threonine/homoserine efflux transporter RhtA
MGKTTAFVLAVAAAALLVVLAQPHDFGTLGDVGVFMAFVALAAAAWVVALGTAISRALRGRESWRWAVVLGMFVWLPALPELIYGASALLATATRNRRRPTAFA